MSAGVGPHIIRSPRNPVSSTDGGGKLAVSLSVAKVIKPTKRACPRQRPVTEMTTPPPPTHTPLLTDTCIHSEPHTHTFRHTHTQDHTVCGQFGQCVERCVVFSFSFASADWSVGPQLQRNWGHL